MNQAVVAAAGLPVAYVLLVLSLAQTACVGLGGLPLAIGSAAMVLAYLRSIDHSDSAPVLRWQSATALVVLAIAIVPRLPRPEIGRSVFILPLLLTLVAAVAGCVIERCSGWRGILLMSAGYAVAGGLAIVLFPAPHIDVFSVQQQGAANLLAGINPYVASYPNIYNAIESRKFLGSVPATIEAYPYPPLQLLLTSVAYALCRDVRAGLLFAQLGIGVVVWRLGLASGQPRRQAYAWAGMYFLNPVNLLVLIQAWNDTVVALLFLLLLLALVRKRFVGLALGLALVAKQYSAVALPILLTPRFIARRWWWLALLCGGLTFLPFLISAPADLLHDITGHLAAPFRADTMAIPPALVRWLDSAPPRGLHFFAALAVMLACWRRLPTGIHGLALALVITYFALFLFSYQGACNYYYFVAVLLLGAAATQPGDSLTS